MFDVALAAKGHLGSRCLNECVWSCLIHSKRWLGLVVFLRRGFEHSHAREPPIGLDWWFGDLNPGPCRE